MVLSIANGVAHVWPERDSLKWGPFCINLPLVGQEPAARWAQRHSAGTFCHGDGRNLTWLPEAGCVGDNGGG